ncbi:MAG: RNA polymerase sigma factor [Bacteroidales bacterium]|jgi:RNA polymerase sigma-70 factor (ECF subfamily)|nr:RNA polymerase sigma factor [Bacteroidales bacterium]
MSRYGDQLSDEEIVKKIRQGNETKLFSLLFNRYYTKVLDKCYSLTHNRDLAEELTGDILSKAYEKLGSYRGKSSFSSWLYSVTYNHCIDYLREKKKLHYPEWNSSNELPEIIDDTYEDESEEISYDILMDLLNRLHTEEKALIMMRYFDEMPLQQIAEALRVTESAAKMRLKRAKARLLFLHKSGR